jgi:GNAT superfamily N-acetyltransferase
MSSLDAARALLVDRTLDLRRLEGTDTHKICEFYRRSLAAGDTVCRSYRWRQAGAPASGGIDTYAVLDRGHIVGATNCVPVSLGWRGHRIQAAWQQDTVVDAAMRGKGIGKALVEASSEAYEMVMSKGTLLAMYALKRGLGFHDARNVKYLIRVLDPRPAAGSLRRRLLFPLLYTAARMRDRRTGGGNLRVRPVAQFDAAFDDFAAKRCEQRELAPLKSSAYLNWRYIDCPTRAYQCHRVDEGDRLRGAVVLRANNHPGGDAWLVDTIVQPGDDISLRVLLHYAFKELSRTRAACVRTFATSPDIRRVLFQCGFISTRESPRFTFRLQRTSSRTVDLMRQDWHFCHGDGDTELLG